MEQTLEKLITEAIEAADRQRARRAAELGVSADELEAHLERARRESERLEAGRRWVVRYRDQLPLEMLESVFHGRLRPSVAMERARAWLATSKPVLILCGGTGTGKTYAAVDALCRSGRGEFVRTMDLPRRVDPWEHELGLGYRPMPLGFRGLLVVDDLGATAENSRVHEALIRVLEARQDPGQRTIITTNLGRRDIRPKYGDRVADRLNALAVVAEVSGPSMRPQGAGL